MEAILEVIMQHEAFRESNYGTTQHMRSQWVAHNIANELATGNEYEKWIVEQIYRRNVDKIAISSSVLDLRPDGNFTGTEILYYIILEGMIPFIYSN